MRAARSPRADGADRRESSGASGSGLPPACLSALKEGGSRFPRGKSGGGGGSGDGLERLPVICFVCPRVPSSLSSMRRAPAVAGGTRPALPQPPVCGGNRQDWCHQSHRSHGKPAGVQGFVEEVGGIHGAHRGLAWSGRPGLFSERDLQDE